MQNVIVSDDGDKRPSAEMVIDLSDQRVAQTGPEGGKNSLSRKKGIAQHHRTRIRESSYRVEAGNVKRRCAAEKSRLGTIQKFVQNEAIPTSARPQLRGGDFVRRRIQVSALTGKGTSDQIAEVQLRSSPNLLHGETAHERVDGCEPIASGRIVSVGIQLPKEIHAGNDVAARSNKTDDRLRSACKWGIIGRADHYRWRR